VPLKVVKYTCNVHTLTIFNGKIIIIDLKALVKLFYDLLYIVISFQELLEEDCVSFSFVIRKV